MTLALVAALATTGGRGPSCSRARSARASRPGCSPSWPSHRRRSPHPWRLRLRLALVLLVLVGLLFLGHLADVEHALALAVPPAGRPARGAGSADSSASVGGHGRREWRLVAAVGLLAIAAIRVLTLVVPAVGPLGDTASDSTVVETVVSVVISLLLAEGLRRGRRLAWIAGLVLGAFYTLLGLFVIAAVVYAQATDQMDQLELVGLAVFVPNAVLWAALFVWLVVGRQPSPSPRDAGAAPLGRHRLGPRGRPRGAAPLGGSTLSWMTTWPENRYLAHEDLPDGGVTAYRVHAGVAVALGDPIGRARRAAAALGSSARRPSARAGCPACSRPPRPSPSTPGPPAGGRCRSPRTPSSTSPDSSSRARRGRTCAARSTGPASEDRRRMVDPLRGATAVVAQVRAISRGVGRRQGAARDGLHPRQRRGGPRPRGPHRPRRRRRGHRPRRHVVAAGVRPATAPSSAGAST